MPPLPRRQLGFAFNTISKAENANGNNTPVVLEVFVDFTCPYSKRMFDTLINDVQPYYGNKLNIIIHPQPHPWHPSSCVVHECFHAACIVANENDDVNLDLMNEILSTTMKVTMIKFADVHTIDMSRRQIHIAFADIYESLGINRDAFLLCLELDTTNEQVNGGNKATQLVKYYVKQSRQLSIHVTPTIRINGIIADSSSSWNLSEWNTFLDPMYC